MFKRPDNIPENDIKVLHVDDNEEFRAEFNERIEEESDKIDILQASCPEEAREKLDDDIDCIVSDYDHKGVDGIEFMNEVREERPALPYILLTGKGSEEIASQMVWRAADYISKSNLNYEVIVNRIENLVSRQRAREALEQNYRKFRSMMEHTRDIVVVLDEEGRIKYTSPSIESVLGYGEEELLGDSAFKYIHPEVREEVTEKLKQAFKGEDVERPVFRFRHKEGHYVWIEAASRDRLQDPAINGMLVNARDVTDKRKRKGELREQNERLKQFGSLVSHDLRNPINIAEGYLDLAKESGDEEDLEKVDNALTRMEEIIDTLSLITVQEGDMEKERLSLSDVFNEAYRYTDGEAVHEAVDDITFYGERSSVVSMFENLILNSIEHNEDEVTIRVGALENGFYYEDDGKGIDEEERGKVFNYGYSGSEDGNGLGLAIANRIAELNGWKLDVAESEAGGARFEVRFEDSGR